MTSTVRLRRVYNTRTGSVWRLDGINVMIAPAATGYMFLVPSSHPPVREWADRHDLKTVMPRTLPEARRILTAIAAIDPIPHDPHVGRRARLTRQPDGTYRSPAGDVVHRADDGQWEIFYRSGRIRGGCATLDVAARRIPIPEPGR